MPGFQVDSWPRELSSLILSVQTQLIRRGNRGTLLGFKPTLSFSPSTFSSSPCLYQTANQSATALFPRVVRSNGDGRESLKTFFFSPFLCSLWNQTLGQKVLPGISSARKWLIKAQGFAIGRWYLLLECLFMVIGWSPQQLRFPTALANKYESMPCSPHALL